MSDADEIEYWKQERTELQEQLEKLERGVLENATLPFIRYLKTRIEELDRYIAKLERR